MQSRPRRSNLTIFVVIAVIVVILIGVGCGYIYLVFKSTSGPNTIKVTANQYYVGDLNRTLLLKVLKNESYDPVSTSPTNTIIRFSAFCGDPSSAEANTTRALFAMGTFYLNGDNTTVELRTKPKSNSETNRNMLEDTTNCAFDKIATIMKDDLDMSLVNQKIDMKKYFIPGFDVLLVVPAMVVISLIWRRKMMSQKK
jgi:hypothetical protein